MKYVKPNFEREWDEAVRYPEFEEMGMESWVQYANENYDIKSFSKIKDVLGNVDLNFEDLEDVKKNRFEKSFQLGKVEIPIAVKFSEDDYDLVAGNTRLAGLVDNNVDPKIWIIDMTKQDLEEAIKMKGKDPCWKGYEMVGTKKKKGKEVPNCVPKNEEEVKETDSGSSGSFEGSAFGEMILKRDIHKLNNSKKPKITEATDSSSSGQYDAPFGDGGKDPLKINGPKSIGKSRAVKDKKFPKWGGPGGVFIKIKEKCKKFPYCNQGDINAIEIMNEIEGLKETIIEISEKHGIPYKKMEEIVVNEIKLIFI